MNFVVTQCVNDFGRRRQTQNATFAFYERRFQRSRRFVQNEIQYFKNPHKPIISSLL